MMRLLRQAVVFLVVIVIAAAGGWWWSGHNARPRPPDAPSLLTQVRETMKLETLEVSLYKKVDFSPERWPADTAWKELFAWLRETLKRPRGRAIVFATAHLGYDLSRLDATALRVQGHRVDFVLPRPTVRVELLPGEMEVIDSNLDSQETAQLLEHARKAMLQEVQKDARLRERARRSAAHSLKALLYSLGFSDVRVVDAFPPPGTG